MNEISKNDSSNDTSNNNVEHVENVKFDMALADSKYINPMRMHYMRKGHQLVWDFALEYDSVSVLLYHLERKELLLVKQFRPPVFIHAVREKPENVEKSLNEIEWSKYPIELGETLELCAGLIDKPGTSTLDHIHQEIMEECGYNVPTDLIQPIKRYVTGVSTSGSTQHLFYAEINESMRVSDGGGNPSEGEFIKKVFMKPEEAAKFRSDINIAIAPPSLLFALTWWLNERCPAS
uniref:Uridine diphosphate glucose pyrophosphatase NUDT14 n=1 Tax=Meloidogyne enterolobii TaxID=390850 RepID=A0A6V7UV36_MELEN|nr:unnamed protein product [Meloidogyne enterolobii]